MKLLIIRCSIESIWGSCRVISPNLQALYSHLESSGNNKIIWHDLDQNVLDVDSEVCSLMLQNLANVLKNAKPDKLIFTDHIPVPSVILSFLSLHMETAKLPPIVMHLYGDFTYFSERWLLLNKHFIGHKIDFIVASDAQRRLVNSFLRENNNVEKICFPVDESQFNFSNESRNKFRKEMNLTEKDFVILYTGRVSLQKNVDLLVREFLKIKNTHDATLHLWVVGEFDDVGAQFFGMKLFEGAMFEKIQSLLSRVPQSIRANIKIWGGQERSKLINILNASDMFASFSLYHDEDYGMSPAEALSTGLCSSLTHWGGYYSFYSKQWECDLIPVTITDYGHKVRVSKFHEYINYVLENRKKLEESRMERSIQFQREFGIMGNVLPLEKIVTKNDQRPFMGFNWLLTQYATFLKLIKNGTIRGGDLIPGRNNFYYQIYKNYIEPAREGCDD